MNIKAFFVDALTSALDLSIGTPDDVVRHVTPDVLSTHLPRPLWARLLTACLGAPRVDAQLIIETIGIPNLCEHIPAPIIWACISEIGKRSIGQVSDTPVQTTVLSRRDLATPVAAVAAAAAAPTPPPPPRPRSITAERQAVLAPPPDERPSAPPPPPPVAVGPAIPALAVTGPESLADVISELEASDPGGEPRLANLRPRSPTAQRFRQSNTAVGRLGSARRPQAAAVPSPAQSASGSSATSSRPRREPTEVSDEPETLAGADGADWRSRDIPVDDSQLVDWQATDGAGVPAAADDDFSDLGRKR